MSSFTDITGQRFGKLVAVKYIGNSEWECVCDCGETTTALAGNLKKGHKKSCGCMKKPFNDILGQKFGMLTATEYIGKSKWKCLCDCGNITIVTNTNLISGNTKSCGCIRGRTLIIDRTGQRFGRLTVIEYAGRGKWKCLCDCGNTKIVRYDKLKSGDTKSCGCLCKSVSSDRIKLVPNSKIRNAYETKHQNIPKNHHITALDGNANNLNDDNICAVDNHTYRFLQNNRLLGLGDITKCAIAAYTLLQMIKEMDS